MHQIHLTLHQVIYIFFVLNKMLWMTKKKFSQEDSVKKFVEKFLSLKPAEFYLGESTNYRINGKRRFKIITNTLLVEINSLLDYLLMNFISQKRKLLVN